LFSYGMSKCFMDAIEHFDSKACASDKRVDATT
jgi:hypothetical protein